MKTIIIKNQLELDAIPLDFIGEIHIAANYTGAIKIPNTKNTGVYFPKNKVKYKFKGVTIKYKLGYADVNAYELRLLMDGYTIDDENV